MITIQSRPCIVGGYVFHEFNVLPLRYHQRPPVPDHQTDIPRPEELDGQHSRPRLRRRMGALGTAQHHLTSILYEYRSTSEKNECGSEAVTFLFPCTTLQNAWITNALSLHQ